MNKLFDVFPPSQSESITHEWLILHGFNRSRYHDERWYHSFKSWVAIPNSCWVFGGRYYTIWEIPYGN